MNSLPIGPRTSPPLTPLMLSRQTFRLKIITFPAESSGYELLISTKLTCSRSETQNQIQHRYIFRKPGQKSTARVKLFVFLVSAFYCVYLGIESSYGTFLATFAVKSAGLHATRVQGAYVTAVFWASFAAAR